jgi:hypothetical protein
MPTKVWRKPPALRATSSTRSSRVSSLPASASESGLSTVSWAMLRTSRSFAGDPFADARRRAGADDFQRGLGVPVEAGDGQPGGDAAHHAGAEQHGDAGGPADAFDEIHHVSMN